MMESNRLFQIRIRLAMLENSLDVTEMTLRSSWTNLPAPLKRHEDALLRRFLFPMIVRCDRLLMECIIRAEAIAGSASPEEKAMGVELLDALEEKKKHMDEARRFLDEHRYESVMDSFGCVKRGLEEAHRGIDSTLSSRFGSRHGRANGKRCRKNGRD